MKHFIAALRYGQFSSCLQLGGVR